MRILYRTRMVCTIRVWYIPYAYGTYHTRTVRFSVPYAYGIGIRVRYVPYAYYAFSQCLLALPSPSYNGLSLQTFLALHCLCKANNLANELCKCYQLCNMAPHCLCIFIYYIHSSSFEDPIYVCVLFLFVHTVSSTTTHIHHTGPTAQINMDVVNFKEYIAIYIQIRVAKHIVPSTVSSEWLQHT